jgi:heat shock protein 1/8
VDPPRTKTYLPSHHRFSEIEHDKHPRVIQHPDLPDVPAYKVQILQAAPSPLPLPLTASNTPMASHVATPRSEPIPAERILTVSEATTIFIRSLVRSAEDFLGKPVRDAVVCIPSWFDEAGRSALEKACEDADVKVLQFLDYASAVAAVSAITPTYALDRIQLVVDLGASSLELALIAVRDGLSCSLASASNRTLGGDQIDDRLIKYFAKEFTKKTKVPLTVCPSSDPANRRAEAKLRLAVEHTKRTISASPGAATCSVESLKDGVDFSGSINRLRFDMEVRSIYKAVVDKAREMVEGRGQGMDMHEIDEVVYLGGSTSLPGLDEELRAALADDVVSPFQAGGTVVGGGAGDPTTILARGCAVQGALLGSLGVGDRDGEAMESEQLREAFVHGHELSARARALSRTVGLVFPVSGDMAGVLSRDTVLPARRRMTFFVDLGGEGTHSIGFEVWELKEGVQVTSAPPPKLEGEEEEEEEEEEIQIKSRTVEKESYLGSLTFEAKLAKKQKNGRKTKVEVQMVVDKDGKLEVSGWEAGSSEKVSLVLSVPPR